MAYMTKKLRHYIELSDNTLHVPIGFERFIDKFKAKENFIIRKGNQGYCTYCHNDFTTLAKINTYTKCPVCKGRFKVRKNNLKHYTSKKDLILLDKVEDKYVLRVFELLSTYVYDLRKFKYQCTEYRRVFFDETDTEIVEGDNVFHTMGLSVVWHNVERTCWKKKVWSWYYSSYADTYGYIYPSNIKQLFKGTKYQYSQLWKIVTKIKLINLVQVFQECLSSYPVAFELLVKLKLYNLALCSNKFRNVKGSFEERFGVPKYLLPFMQKYNITYDELEVLRYCKVPDIRLIRSLVGFNYLGWLSCMVDIEKAWRSGLLSRKLRNTYYDYLESCYKLQYDFKDKKIIYPPKDKLYELHDKVIKLVEVAENELNDNLIKKRAKELDKYKYQYKGLIIQCFQDLQSIIDEASQMNNCVFTNYSEKYAMGNCNLFTVRKVNDISKSLITVETDVNNTKIIQAEQSHHRSITTEQQKFLNKWLKHIQQRTVILNA